MRKLTSANLYYSLDSNWCNLFPIIINQLMLALIASNVGFIMPALLATLRSQIRGLEVTPRVRAAASELLRWTQHLQHLLLLLRS